MTMRVTVKNEDSSRTATVQTIEKNDRGETTSVTPKDLAPGESADFWLHSARSLSVDEKPLEPPTT